ncbi:phage virion morphogenesis protein [Desulfobacter hydrogenophilus]|uniref:Phage virion morphogenesis protein n=1 Tax=Desulfobacter hydrogenophilus TaxID=2291 RepID=A0A328F712_9BACT|nr:phage virion morphogenesis protein [Desulfobacter hydrogenophilus]NDY73981.1 phage virion morphogenesis protein [Desulfobacter hydrogenophilus]QBH14326.1 phage virion morphogenesis protein [Desulfobacter hydrogenophilus]RAM00328.1 phage virion morphogenesis protein [Desulfobacter hydrogenophilus]
MAGASFSMDFHRINRVLGSAVTVLNDRQELAETLGEQFVSATLGRFETGTGPDGEEWAKSARAENESGRTLVDKGGLKGSINYEASSTAVAVGTSDQVKGAIHQFGGTIKPKSAGALKFKTPNGFVITKKVEIPARPYIGLNQEDVDEAAETIRLFMQRGLGGR